MVSRSWRSRGKNVGWPPSDTDTILSGKVDPGKIIQRVKRPYRTAHLLTAGEAYEVHGFEPIISRVPARNGTGDQPDRIDPAVHAQVLYGSLVGNVTDATGAAVPGAAVVLTNRATALVRRATSDDRGQYSFNDLQLGDYDATVSASGAS